MAYRKRSATTRRRTTRTAKRNSKRTTNVRRSTGRSGSPRAGTLKIVVESGTARPSTLADASVVSRAKLRTL